MIEPLIFLSANTEVSYSYAHLEGIQLYLKKYLTCKVL